MPGDWDKLPAVFSSYPPSVWPQTGSNVQDTIHNYSAHKSQENLSLRAKRQSTKEHQSRDDTGVAMQRDQSSPFTGGPEAHRELPLPRLRSHAGRNKSPSSGQMLALAVSSFSLGCSPSIIHICIVKRCNFEYKYKVLQVLLRKPKFNK